MKVIYHIGLHCTDEDRALRLLLKNSTELEAEGTLVPPPGRFRHLLREALIELKGDPAPQETQSQILAGLTDGPVSAIKRLIFSHDSFLGVAARAISGTDLYPLASERLPWIRNLFPQDAAEVHFALRNPATLIPALHSRFAKEASFGEYLDRIDPEALSWVPTIARMRDAVPDTPLTLWSNEDTPFLWPEIIQALSGVSDATRLKGIHDFLGSIMTEAGLERMIDYMETHPPKTVDHRQRVVSAFLDKYAKPEAVEEEYDLPGWTEERIAVLTARYEEDLNAIAAMDGITVLRT